MTPSRLSHLRSRLLSSRIARGSAAGFLGFGFYAVTQLISVPVLAWAFGIEGFGIWILVSTVPTYLGLAELGFTQAAVSDMLMSWAAERRQDTHRVFQSAALLLCGICTLILLIAGAGIAVALALGSSFVAEYWPLIAAFVVLQVLTMLSGLPSGLLRATGHWVRATLLWDIAGFVETLAMLTVAAVTRDLALAAVAQVAVRLLTLLLHVWQARRHRPEIDFGTRFASRAEMRRLLVPAASMMALPLSIAFSVQGTIVIIGALLGPAAVATFTPMRTVSRMILQVLRTISVGIMPELAGARGRGDLARVRRLWRLNNLVVSLALAAAGAGVALFGAPFVSLWTGGHVQPSPLLALLVGIDVLPFGWWYLATFLLTGTNDHVKVMKWILACSALGFGLVLVTTHYLGLPGTVAALIFFDVVIAVRVHLFVRKLIAPAEDEDIPPFLDQAESTSAATRSATEV